MRFFSNTVLLVAATLSLLVLALELDDIERLLGEAHAARNAILFLVLPACAAAAALLGLRLRREMRATVAICLVAAVLGAYGAEGFLAWRIAQAPIDAAERLGLARDGRSTRQVIADMERDGKHVLPALWPGLVLTPGRDGVARSSLAIEGHETIPVGGVSGVTTIMCREAGPYVLYEADRHGFNNPDAVWDRPTQLMLVGDSFAQGQCVPPDAQMATRLRALIPGTVTVGMGHNGPLLELAALKEFGPLLKPRAVIWLYFQGNDLIEDLPRESKSPLLMRYLDPGFSQNLPARQAAIDTALRVYLAGASRERNQSREWLVAMLESVVKLRDLRRILGARHEGPTPDIALFARILQEARATVAGWGGALYFVYLPSWLEMMQPSQADDILRAQVMDTAREAGLPIVDLYGPMTSEGDPSAFFYYPAGHYSPEGQAEVADAILQALPPSLVGAPAE